MDSSFAPCSIRTDLDSRSASHHRLSGWASTVLLPSHQPTLRSKEKRAAFGSGTKLCVAQLLLSFINKSGGVCLPKFREKMEISF